MAYPGNPELSVQAQERVIAAFRQVINKLQQGQRQEALLGLEFVLRMDASFTPATNLHEQLSSGAEQIDLAAVISDLQASSTDSINELLVGAVDAYNNRDYVEAEEMVRKVLVELPGHQQARELLAQIEEALKVGSQAGNFLAQAQEALDNNEPQEAANFVMMAQALDPHFSGIDAMLRVIQEASQKPQVETAPDEDQAAYQTMAFDTSAVPQEGAESPKPDISFDVPDSQDAQDAQDANDANEQPAQDFTFEAAPSEAPQAFDFEPAAEPAAKDEAPQDFAFEAADPAEAESSEDFSFDSAKPDAPAEEAQDFSFDSGDQDLFSVDPQPADGAPETDGGTASEESFGFDTDESEQDDSSTSSEFAFGGEEEVKPAVAEDSLFTASDSPDLFSSDPADDTGGENFSPGVEALLQEGQDAFDGGAFDKAIEIWSRIFAIDPSNSTASELIDNALIKQAETQKKIEHMLADAADSEKSGDVSKALGLANAILAINPESPEAIDMKNRLDASAPEDLLPIDAIPTPPDTDTSEDLFKDVGPEDLGGSGEDIPDIDLDIPDAKQKKGMVVVKKTIPWRLIAVIGAAVAVILVGAWMGSRFLANAKADKQVEALNQVLEQADQLYKDSRIDEAIHLLREYGATDLDRERIARRIEKYNESQKTPTPTPVPDSRIEAEKLLKEEKWLSAYKLADEGLAKHPQDLGLSEFRDSISRIDADIAPIVNALKKSDYKTAEKLCRGMVKRYPENTEVMHTFTRCLFNSSLKDLRSYNLTGAETSLKNLAELMPDDEETLRILDFVSKYKARPVDMQLEIFISSIKER